jgi:hypothetical protein
LTLKDDLSTLRASQFVTLILDNEVTAGEFVADPPVSWTRMVQQNGVFRIAEGYPTVLTAAQGKFEMRNWDEVSLPGIVQTLAKLTNAVDFVVIGNNAGQGLPLARAVPQGLRENQGAIIYANSLPERDAYERLGYRNFYRRRQITPRLLEAAKAVGRSLALCFINTIQHNERNYHDP